LGSIDTQGPRGTRLTAGVHGSVPKLLTVSDAMRSHARCVYRPPGMSWTPNGTSHGGRFESETMMNEVDTKSKPSSWG